MNKQRRKQILDIKNQLEQNINELQSVLDEEQYSYDNMPENLQFSMRGEEMEDAITTMEEAIESIQSAIESLEEI